jgi:hypothetical protein
LTLAHLSNSLAATTGHGTAVCGQAITIPTPDGIARC